MFVGWRLSINGAALWRKLGISQKVIQTDKGDGGLPNCDQKHHLLSGEGGQPESDQMGEGGLPKSDQNERG